MARTEDGDGDTGEHGEIERRDEQRTTASGRLRRRSVVIATVVSGSMAERETPVSFFFFSLVPLLLCFQVNFFSSAILWFWFHLLFFAAYFLSHLHLSIFLLEKSCSAWVERSGFGEAASAMWMPNFRSDLG